MMFLQATYTLCAPHTPPSIMRHLSGYLAIAIAVAADVLHFICVNDDGVQIRAIALRGAQSKNDTPNRYTCKRARWEGAQRSRNLIKHAKQAFVGWTRTQALMVETLNLLSIYGDAM